MRCVGPNPVLPPGTTPIFLVCCLYLYHGNLTQVTKANMIKEIKLKVDDIPCTGCAEDMETVLRDQAGILEAKVHYSDDIIDIKYDSEVIERPAVIHAARRVANISDIISEQ